MVAQLKVIFICSSLEPGYDGVGDYSRRLAAALIKAGHKCAILSLNDRHVNDTLVGLQHADGADVPVMRLSSAIKIKPRFAFAKIWIDGIDPQWLSLQFVPFGYHSRGLKVGLSNLLLSLGAERKWHIMFHELWVGIANEESKKLHWWGAAQRMLIRSLVKKLNPAVIHTQTYLYQELLAKIGFRAVYLPLYGNIPVIGRALESSDTEEKISFVVFGSIHDRAPIEAFANEAAGYAKKNGITINLSIIGRGNAEQQRWAQAWQNEGLPVQMLGELPAEEISAIFTKSTIGLSATALAVIEKSGSYAAMREHGLPIISVAKAWTPTGIAKIAIPAGVMEYAPGNFEKCIAGSKFILYGNSVNGAAIKFANTLIGFKAE